jgi:hypothetical protein
MSGVSSASATWLQSQTAASNWVQSAVTSDSTGSADWMSPSASSDPVDMAANAFAAAEQQGASGKSSLAVNEGISVLQRQLGQSVNILA